MQVYQPCSLEHAKGSINEPRDTAMAGGKDGNTAEFNGDRDDAITARSRIHLFFSGVSRYR